MTKPELPEWIKLVMRQLAHMAQDKGTPDETGIVLAGTYESHTTALLEHCMKLREALEKAAQDIDHCRRSGIPHRIDNKLYTVLVDIGKAVQHKPEGVA